MKSGEERMEGYLDVLANGSPHEKSMTLYTVAGTRTPEPALLSAIECLLDDRSVVQMYVPFRYGELRYIAGDTLALLRARVGDMRPVVLANVPTTLNVDKMFQLRHSAGLDDFVGEPTEEYADLLKRRLVRIKDDLFDPGDYRDD